MGCLSLLGCEFLAGPLGLKTFVNVQVHASPTTLSEITTSWCHPQTPAETTVQTGWGWVAADTGHLLCASIYQGLACSPENGGRGGPAAEAPSSFAKCEK